MSTDSPVTDENADPVPLVSDVTNHNIQLGVRGEDLAERHLLERDRAEIVARNWRCRHGELDIIALINADQCGGTVPPTRPILAFVEVKTRRGLGFGDPMESITDEKLNRLRLLAGTYMCEHPANVQMRIDGIGVLWEPGRQPRVSHLTGLDSAWG